MEKEVCLFIKTSPLIAQGARDSHGDSPTLFGGEDESSRAEGLRLFPPRQKAAGQKKLCLFNKTSPLIAQDVRAAASNSAQPAPVTPAQPPRSTPAQPPTIASPASREGASQPQKHSTAEKGVSIYQDIAFDCSGCARDRRGRGRDPLAGRISFRTLWAYLLGFAEESTVSPVAAASEQGLVRRENN
jgi:hypothetical protein